MHACWQNELGIWMILYGNIGGAAKGMHLWIWMLQMPNANNPTTILHTIRTNIQHAIIAAKKVISHAMLKLSCNVVQMSYNVVQCCCCLKAQNN